MADISSHSDIMSCIDEFIGHKCLVAVEHSQETEEPFGGDYDDGERNNGYERPQYPRLCRVHITTKLKNPGTTAETIATEQVLTADEHIEVGTDADGNLLAAHDNGRIAVVERDGATNTDQVKYMGLDEAKKCKIVRLPERAYSVHVIGTTVYLGFSTSFGWIDFSSKTPEYEEIFRRQFGDASTQNGRRYDMIIHKDDLLLLIGNLLGSYYAETFHLPRGNGPPIYQEPWPLPGTHAGRYTLVGIAGSDLLIVYGFVGRNRNGQCILRRSINELSPSARCQIEDIKEIRGSITNRNPYDCSEDKWWKSIAIQKNNRGEDCHILFAAGKQGIVTLPTNFERTTEPKHIQEAGSSSIITTCFVEEVSSVRTFGDEVWILLNRRGATLTSSGEYSILMRLGNDQRITLPGYFDELL